MKRLFHRKSIQPCGSAQHTKRHKREQVAMLGAAAMKRFEMVNRLADTAADSVGNPAVQDAALESHLLALREEFETLQRIGAKATELGELQLQMARTLVGLNRGEEAWPLGREALSAFLAAEQIESAADCCDVLFRAEQPQSLSALGQGIWLAVTYPIDPELSIELLSHIVDETPDNADGAAVAATTALFIADIRSRGHATREPHLLRLPAARRRGTTPQRDRLAGGLRPLARPTRTARTGEISGAAAQRRRRAGARRLVVRPQPDAGQPTRGQLRRWLARQYGRPTEFGAVGDLCVTAVHAEGRRRAANSRNPPP
jgi:hypothetical protein